MQQLVGRTRVAVARTSSSTPCGPHRISRRRPQPFTGLRGVVATAAASPDAEPPKEAAAPQKQEPQQQRQQRRAPRVVTVPIADIQPGQEYEGVVTKAEAFGAFVNIGSETDGLVHVSQLGDGYVKNVADVIKAGDKVKVKVLTVDTAARRLALTMKGMGNAAGKGQRGGRGASSAAFEADAAADEEDDAFVLEAGDVAFDGIVFRVEDGDYEAEGYDEADEFEAEADAEIALAAALENSLVEGKVSGVEDFGVIVEWTTPDGKKRSGLLHVSEMRAPAAAVEAEAGEAVAAAVASEEGAAGILADEGEFLSEQYVDVGGVDKPSRYYSVGDAIACFVVSAEGGKVSLTQDPASLALDDAADEEGEEFDLEEERLLAQAGAEEGSFVASAFGDAEDEALDVGDVADVGPGEAGAAIYYSLANSAAKVGGAPAFIRGKHGAAVAPSGFPSRGYNISDIDLIVPAANRLVDIDDAGDEAELVDFWSDDIGHVPKGTLKRLGVKIVPNEAGELEVVPREGAEPADDGALELLYGVSEADLDSLADAILADDVEDEAEVPRYARRNPGTLA